MPLFRRALFTLLLAATAFPQTPNHDTAAPRPGPVWSQFRKSHPYHIQAVALSEPDPAGERTLIVSEPPPHVTLDSLRALSPLLSSPKVETQHIGFDGWVKDVTYRLPAISDRDLTALIDRLHYHLFGTTYKAYTIPIDAPPAAPLSAINVRVPASALNAWLVRSRETFRPIFGGVPSTVSALLLRGRSGVFLSDSPGFVVWIVPRKADLRDYTREARQFAVDSDLVLGAIGGASHVAIVARERVEPVAVLPPLRAETIMLLASVDSASLSQSYERRNFFAGRTRLQRLDWAPIYLSDSLIDTEYGSLLNITDQLLKSWSNNGTVHYVGFEYPSPSKWAFPKPVIDMLGVSSLTFNWNTKGAGYTVNLAGAKILAMNRTGALPVSYIPEGAPAEQQKRAEGFENDAYRWFAEVNDPNLARVVQYALLYQIFRDFNVTASKTPASYSHPEQQAMAREAARLLTGFAAAPAATIEGYPEGMKLSPQEVAQARQGLRELQKDLIEYRTLTGDTTFLALGMTVANPRAGYAEYDRALAKTEARRTRRDIAILAQQFLLRKLSSGITAEVLRANLVDTTRSVEIYVRAAVRTPPGWVKTPSVVLSSFVGGNLVGGHNLDSAVTRYAVSPEVPAGKVAVTEVGGQRVIRVNPADADRIPAMLRTAATSREAPAVLARNLALEMRAAEPVPASRAVALMLPKRLEEAPAGHILDRGLVAGDLPAGTPRSGMWAHNPAPSAVNPAAELSHGGIRTLHIARNSDMTYTIHSPSSDVPFVTANYEEAVDVAVSAVRGGDPPGGRWSLAFDGLEKEESQNFLYTVEVQGKLKSQEDLQLAGFGMSRRSDAAALRRTLGEHYDVARARILEVEVEPAASAAEHQAVRMTVEFPSYTAGKPPFLMRIRLVFREFVSRPLQEFARSLVEQILTRHAAAAAARGERLTVQSITDSLRMDLKKMQAPEVRRLNLEITMPTDAGDVLIIGLVPSWTEAGHALAA